MQTRDNERRRNTHRGARRRLAAGAVWAALAGFGAALLAAAPDVRPEAVLLKVDGVIGPATTDYVLRALDHAGERGAALVVIQMDTPGGLDTSMREIIQGIIASPVPVATYVSPSGARAASAGTYILYASHIAAMAPATNLGAATPVQLGGLPSPGEPKDKAADEGKQPASDAMTHKIINDAVAYIRGLANMRGRNAEWAERAVREAASLSAREALAKGVIDIVANDIDDLLRQIDGRRVSVLGHDRVLQTSGLQLVSIEPDWRSRLLAVITNPNVAYVLMLVGIYGLIYEFANPGLILPGVAGAISLLLALYAFHVLPVNFAGLALMLLGVAFMVGEVFVPSFGALGIGGAIAFVIGSIILLDTGLPGYDISWLLIGTFAALNALVFMVVIGLALKARARPVVSGQEELVGGIGEALEDFDRDGHIRIHSESWRARSRAPVRAGQRVRVTAIDGLVLSVEELDEGNTEE